MARNWRDVRAEAFAQGRVDPKRVEAARKEMHDAVQAHRLTDIRKAHGHARQADVAKLMGVSQAPQLSLMTGDQALQPMTTTNTQSDQKAANGTAPKSDAFNRGYSEASQCVSQNAGPYCAAMSGPAWQACLTDYRNGYQVGLTEQNRKLGEATQAGLQDGKNGKPDGSFNDPRATGGCRDEWVGSYGNGYYKGRHASDQVMGK
mgnify:CR=1 FL=1